MSAKPSFLGELKRRNVLRAGILYVGVIWALSQGAAQLLPVFDVPNWVVRAFVIAGIVGFPFWLAFSWFYELTPEGIKRESDAPVDASVARSTGRKFDFAIIAVLAVAVVLLLTERMTPRSNASDKSVAVLPFTDMSPGQDQGYFSDGMSEELLNALAKVKDLKVAGRTSSFSFKGKNQDMRAIGDALGVANIVEGSVRKQGDRVRITAQLVKASNGFHLWSESYDGDLKDVFELQERIARSITDSLKVVLVGGQQDRIVPVATTSADAYALYLQATEVFNHRDGAKFAEAIAKLDRAIELDPKFARAHARLAALYAVSQNYTAMNPDDSLAATQREAKAASDLDPTLAEPYAALGLASQLHRHWLEAFALFEKALALDANDINANFWYASSRICAGYLADGTARMDRVLALDPLLPNALGWRGIRYMAVGDYARSEAMLKQSMDAGLAMGARRMAHLLHAQGRDAEARALAPVGWRGLWAGVPTQYVDVIGDGVFGSAEERAKAIAAVEAYVATDPKPLIGSAPWSLMLLGEPERAMALAAPAPTTNDALIFEWLWTPLGDELRRSPHFGAFAQQVGFAELWDKKGPPDRCRRVAPLDYACD